MRSGIKVVETQPQFKIQGVRVCECVVLKIVHPENFLPPSSPNILIE